MIRCLRTTCSARSAAGRRSGSPPCARRARRAPRPRAASASRRPKRARRRASRRRARRASGASVVLRAGTRRSGTRGSRSSPGTRRRSARRHRVAIVSPGRRDRPVRPPPRPGLPWRPWDHFFHAVRVFCDHLAAVRWQFLALALALHLARLVPARGRLAHDPRAAYPGERLRLPQRASAPTSRASASTRSSPARAGDVVKLYLDQAPDPGLDATRRSRRRWSPRRCSTSSSRAR